MDVTRTGWLTPSPLKQMLPMLAMMVVGYMTKQGGGAAAQPAEASGGLGGLLGGGNALDDVPRMAGKITR